MPPEELSTRHPFSQDAAIAAVSDAAILAQAPPATASNKPDKSNREMRFMSGPS
jgi:hypothetical protein